MIRRSGVMASVTSRNRSAQIPVAKARKAELYGWQRLFDSVRYTIAGPHGAIDMELMAKGRIIPGLAPNANVRRCFIDPEVWAVTGLDPKTGFAPKAPKTPKADPAPTPKPAPKAKPSPGGALIPNTPNPA